MTEQETEFMRELRQLLRRHMVEIHNTPEICVGFHCELRHEPEEWDFRGPAIELPIHILHEELKQP